MRKKIKIINLFFSHSVSEFYGVFHEEKKEKLKSLIWFFLIMSLSFTDSHENKKAKIKNQLFLVSS
jgi:hypothetical protein